MDGYIINNVLQLTRDDSSGGGGKRSTLPPPLSRCHLMSRRSLLLLSRSLAPSISLALRTGSRSVTLSHTHLNYGMRTRSLRNQATPHSITLSLSPQSFPGPIPPKNISVGGGDLLYCTPLCPHPLPPWLYWSLCYTVPAGSVRSIVHPVFGCRTLRIFIFYFLNSFLGKIFKIQKKLLIDAKPF